MNDSLAWVFFNRDVHTHCHFQTIYLSKPPLNTGPIFPYLKQNLVDSCR